jgi:hypothetical protein
VTLDSTVLPEPLLEFGQAQKIEHPKDGLFLYGPVAGLGNPQLIQAGIIGTKEGINLVRNWIRGLNEFIPATDPMKLHSSHWPGFQAAFGIPLAPNPLVVIPIDSLDISNALGKSNRVDAVRSTVRLFEEAILEHLRTDERRPDVWLVVVPEHVHRYARPKAAGPKETTKSTLMSERAAARILRRGSLFSEMTDEAQTYLFARNFHHQLKAQLLHTEAVIQVIRETTLDPSLDTNQFGNPTRSVQERAAIAWNLSTTLYFKGARLQPWQLANVRPGVCYVGLVFKIDPSPAREGEACCAAQMFLNSGNGVVFRGALGPWYSTRDREFHLGHEAARSLMSQVVDTYRKDHGGPPNEVFIHGRQRFSAEEWDGFCAGLPAETKHLVGVRIRTTQDLRLFRPEQDVPVLRGTAVLASDRVGYLWTTGYIPRLRTYPGFETPKPLLIDIHRGQGDLRTVMQDVLGLTKLNYNCCDYSSGLPVTLKFADRVGEILMASPKGRTAPPLPFRFYI